MSHAPADGALDEHIRERLSNEWRDAVPRASAAAATPVAGPRLVVVEGPDRGRTYPLGEGGTIGRAPDNAYFLPDPTVSKHHARLRRAGAGWEVEDLASKNGTCVNGERSARRGLVPGDRITIGTSTLQLET